MSGKPANKAVAKVPYRPKPRVRNDDFGASPLPAGFPWTPAPSQCNYQENDTVSVSNLAKGPMDNYRPYFFNSFGKPGAKPAQ